MSTTIPSAQVQHTSQSQGNTKPTSSSSSATRLYLILYNLVSLILWATLLLRLLTTVFVPSSADPTVLNVKAVDAYQTRIGKIYTVNGNYAKWIQTLALLEVVHAMVGLVRSSVMTTAMQVASRILLVWGVIELYGDKMLAGLAGVESVAVLRIQQAYFGMLFAWGVAECIRYAYFVFSLALGSVPAPLLWLRYNAFFVLYPIGISCECFMVYKALPYARQHGIYYDWFLIAALAIYVPGSYILYTHMMSQRRRIMKGKQKDRGD